MKKESTRTTSIARKINGECVQRKIADFLWVDIIIVAMVIACWCYMREVDFFGDFLWNRGSRYFDIQEGIANVKYVVNTGAGRVLTADAGNLLILIRNCAIVLGALQVMSILHSILFDAKKIRYELHPLNDLARKAEELSSIAFDESKYHRLEDAISNVNPDGGKEHLKVGDKDLEGLEMAVNNLIDRMRESYRQQAQFVSDASHELRTPISVIQGYANMLDRWGKEDESVLEESITAIRNESDHMSKLVDQLLFLARSDSGRNKMVREEILLDSLMEEVYEESRMIDDSHIYSLRKPEQSGIKIMGDPTMIKQTMRILTENAVKYTKAGDEIIFASGIKENEMFFYVQDSGVGMDEKDVIYIFERFYRSDEARNSKTGGSGLGLSIAKWIVDKHKGHFDILSRKDLGTRITVYFPIN